jgi:hypothetical protein
MIDSVSGLLMSDWNEEITMVGGGTVVGGIFNGTTFQNNNKWRAKFDAGIIIFRNGDPFIKIQFAPESRFVPAESQHEGRINDVPTSGIGRGEIAGAAVSEGPLPVWVLAAVILALHICHVIVRNENSTGGVRGLRKI